MTQDEKHLGKTLKKSVQLSAEELAEINNKEGRRMAIILEGRDAAGKGVRFVGS